jgi:ankyrin repeat protein
MPQEHPESLTRARWWLILIVPLGFVMVAIGCLAAVRHLRHRRLVSALTGAVNCDDADAAAALLSQGIEANSSEGASALSLAAGRGRVEVMKVLLDYGADPNARGVEGDTPLICAATSGEPEAVRMLLEAGADVNAENMHGHTALSWADWASHQGDREGIIKLLKDAGGRPGDNPLPIVAPWFAESGGTTKWVLIGVTVAISACIVTFVAVLLNRRKRGPGQPPRNTDAAEQQWSSDDSPPNNPAPDRATADD